MAWAGTAGAGMAGADTADATRLEIHPREGGPVAVYTVAPPLKDVSAALARLADPVLHRGVARREGEALPDGLTGDAAHAVEIGFLPGVTDNEGATAREMLVAAGLAGTQARVHASRVWLLPVGEDPQAHAAAHHNPLIERAAICSAADYAASAPIVLPQVRLADHGTVVTVPLPDDEGALAELSARGIVGPDGRARGPLGLSVADFEAIRAHFASLGRDPTDVEIETLAQSWSEHCKHRIFAAAIDGDADCPDGLFRTFVAGATRAILARPEKDGFCLSVFDDNAGAIAFDDEWMVCDKVETHNSPSALDPYGGAMTGIVGVNRDVLGFGLGARPVANRYGFCFGHPGDVRPLYRDAARTNALPSVDAIIRGVERGVEDGGNQSGIPTCQGFLVHDDSYRGKPLVFCGTVGLMPRRLPDGRGGTRAGEEKGARPGDAILMVGGRVGLDGVHGATFSSVALDEASPATAVQIGDPITQKRMSDAILTEARDAGLYTSITDNGAGGLSSSVGEMARESGGAEVWLDRVPLKYPGLAPWEVWVSESQERMTLAVPPENVAETIAVFARHGVEATEIGRFTGDGAVTLRWGEGEVGRLDLGFLHGGSPRLRLTARRPERPEPAPLPPIPSLDDVIPKLLAMTAVPERTGLARRYDHEVQATSLVKPLQGPGLMPGDATAIAPVPGSPRAVGMTDALLPHLTEPEPYACAVLSVDLAVRRLVALGCDLDRIALLDNICWSSPEEPGRVWLLHETMRGAHDAAVRFGAPFISGKDSMYNDFRGFDADGEPLHVAALPTLLISGLGILADREHAQTMDLKIEGDVIALMGGDPTGLGGSLYARALGWNGIAPPAADLPDPAAYRALADAMAAGRIASAVALGAGGLGVALARACLAGSLGAEVDVPLAPGARADAALFAEGAGGVLASMAPAEFDALQAPLGLTRLGTVTPDGALRIRAGGVAIEHSAADLLAAIGRAPGMAA